MALTPSTPTLTTETNILKMNMPLLQSVLRHNLCVLLLAGLLLELPARAQTPPYMTYQGYLTDQNGNALGTNGPQNYDILFRIWNQPTGGSAPLYGELQTVTVANGYFSVLLGQGNSYVSSGGTTDPRPPLAMVFTTNNLTATARYVEMTVKGLGTGGGDVTILPRLQLVSAPYAFMAANANALVDPVTGNTLISNAGTNVTISGSIAANSFNGNLTDLGGSLYLDNSQLIYGKNTSGNYEPFLWPRSSDNVSYLNYGAGGFNIRNNSSATAMWLSPLGNVGIGTTTPGFPLTFGNVLGDKLSLWGQSGNNFGFGIAGSLLQIHTDVSGSDIAFGYGTSAAMTELMRIKGSGKVGIGTSAPQRQLTVNAGTATPGSDNTYQAGIGTGSKQLILGYDTADDAAVIAASDYETAWKNISLTPAGGYVGVGTLSPQAELHVSSGNNMVQLIDSSSTGGTWDMLRNTSPGGESWQMISTGSGNGEGAGKLMFTCGPSPGFVTNHVLTLTPGGLVGIGTYSPSQAQVEVRYHAPLSQVSGYGYLNTGGAGAVPSGSGSGYFPWSILADGRILAVEFDAYSDVRIKKIQGHSDSRQDLQTLRGLQITDYTMVDTVANGNRSFKKVIAQQVEKVYPQAVALSTNVVPDIFAKAEAKDGWVRLTHPPTPALKVGERLRMITGQDNAVQTVIEVATNGFRIAEPLNGTVFVYGREVSDFRTVDYDAISMLNVSATQELAKRLDRLEAREVHLTELEAKAAQLAALVNEVEDLKKMVAQLAAAGKGAKLATDKDPADKPEIGSSGVTKAFTTASRDH